MASWGSREGGRAEWCREDGVLETGTRVPGHTRGGGGDRGLSGYRRGPEGGDTQVRVEVGEQVGYTRVPEGP